VRHFKRQVMNVTRELEEARDQNHEMSTDLNNLTIEKHSVAKKFEDMVCDYKSALTDHTALTDKCEALIQENAALTKKLQSLEQNNKGQEKKQMAVPSMVDEGAVRCEQGARCEVRANSSIGSHHLLLGQAANGGGSVEGGLGVQAVGLWSSKASVVSWCLLRPQAGEGRGGGVGHHHHSNPLPAPPLPPLPKEAQCSSNEWVELSDEESPTPVRDICPPPLQTALKLKQEVSNAAAHPLKNLQQQGLPVPATKKAHGGVTHLDVATAVTPERCVSPYRTKKRERGRRTILLSHRVPSHDISQEASSTGASLGV
jgi:hypothetical protein